MLGKRLVQRMRLQIQSLADFRHGIRLYHKYQSSTMIRPQTYANNLMVARQARSVSGCVVECGTWKGGMLAGLAEVLGPDRKYFGFDSFEGWPPAQEIDGATAIAWQSDSTSPTYFDNCSASREDVERALSRSGASQVSLIKGWFDQTLTNWTAPEPIALLRLDADWYESTMTCLTHLVPQVAPGGFVLIDDYYAWDGCSKAVHDWFSRHKLPVRICQMNNDVCYFTVSDETAAQLRNQSEASNTQSLVGGASLSR